MKRTLLLCLSAAWLCAVPAAPAITTTADLPRLEKLDSVVLAGVHYDARTETMLLKKRDGTVIEYSGVPHEIYERLKEHPLKGGFYRGHIANRYPSRVVPPAPEPEEVEADEAEAAAAAEDQADAPVAVAEPAPAPAPAAEPEPVVAEVAPEEDEIPTISVVPAAVAAAAADMPDLPDDFDEMLETTVERAEAVAETLDDELFSVLDDAGGTTDEALEEILDAATEDKDLDDLLSSLDDLLK